MSLCFKLLIVFGVSRLAGLETLQTRRSPSAVWVASISDFCFEDDECHANVTIGDGAREVVKVCKGVKEGCRVAINIDPLRYLYYINTDFKLAKTSQYPIAYV